MRLPAAGVGDGEEKEMSIKVTAENSQDIMDTFNEWKKSLPLEKRGLVDAHINALMEENDKRNRMPNLGLQSRCVCLAVIYIFFLEHFMEGRPMPKMCEEI